MTTEAGPAAAAAVESGFVTRVLTPSDLRRVRVSRWSTTSLQRLVEIVGAYPSRSVWHPESGQYAVVSGWRHRREIAHLFELAAPRDPVVLSEAAMRVALADDAQLFVAIETDRVRQAAFYDRLGMSLMEEVVSLEHPAPRLLKAPGDGIVPLRTLDDATVEGLIRVDHAAFPWLWRNSADEFRVYVEEPGVELYGYPVDGRIAAYIGVTAFLGWGHIDRVAVDPALQGQGVGNYLTRFGMDRLIRLGARRIGLSTQRSNDAAKGMYAKLGFARQIDTDYRLYGRWLGDGGPPSDDLQ